MFLTLSSPTTKGSPIKKTTTVNRTGGNSVNVRTEKNQETRRFKKKGFGKVFSR